MFKSNLIDCKKYLRMKLLERKDDIDKKKSSQLDYLPSLDLLNRVGIVQI